MTDNNLREQEKAKMFDALKYAHWVNNNNGTITCSHCGTWFNKDDRYFYMRYCPYCNKEMRGKR